MIMGASTSKYFILHAGEEFGRASLDRAWLDHGASPLGGVVPVRLQAV